MVMAQIELPMEDLTQFCRKWRVKELSVFGSVLREDFRQQSDMDFLVTIDPDTHYSLFDIVHMQQELSELMGRPVDLAERPAVESSENYIRRKHILNSARRIYVAG